MANYGNPPIGVDEGKWIPTVCNMCFNACGIRAQVVNGVCFRIEGNPDSPHGQGKICAKGLSGVMKLYAPNRLKNPMKRTNPEKGIGIDPGWVEIDWEEAIDTVSMRLKKVLEEDPRKLVWGGIDYHSYVASMLFWIGFGTPNRWQGGTAYWCGNNVHSHSYMWAGGFFHEPDYRYCKYLLLVGAQYGCPVSTNAVPLTTKQAKARKKGMKVVVVDPVCVNVAGRADEWIPIRPGTDGAFALGIGNVLVNELGIYDEEFLRDKTNGPYLVKPDGYYLRDEKTRKPMCWDILQEEAKPFDSIPPEHVELEGNYEVEGLEVNTAFKLLKLHLTQYTPRKVSEITTIPVETIRRVAKEWGEAASIGSTVTIQGKQVPIRPVACIWSKGPAQHYNAFQTGTALQMLNVLAGSIETPGGYLSCLPKGPFWGPTADPDGMIRGDPFTNYCSKPYPARKAIRPYTIDLFGLFPVALYSDAAFEEGMLHPEKYKLDYRPEVLVTFFTDFMTNSGNPDRISYILKKFDFIVSFTTTLNATTEFSDIVLPDTQYLEKLEPLPNMIGEWVLPGLGDWYWTITQPVVPPAGQSRYWVDVTKEIAERIGILEDFNIAFNSIYSLRGQFKLDPQKKYTWEEMTDRVLANTTGFTLKDYKKRGGFIRHPKKLEEVYHFRFNDNKYRCPVYLEHLLGAGEDVKKVSEELGIEWDTSQFVPMVTWFPCPEYRNDRGDYDLYAVNYKIPIHTFAHTLDNAWLAELGGHRPDAYKIKINSETAKRKCLRDGDEVWLETNAGWVDSEGKQRPPGRVRGVLKVVEGIHHECVGIAGNFGHWAMGTPIAKGKGIHFNTLVSYDIKRIDPLACALDNCILVKIYKV